ncbi:MAG: hypothetical protein VXY27_00865 [Thermoproteota archaeon]|nr:hypothetical protein [Thermoproteota archaeon]
MKLYDVKLLTVTCEFLAQKNVIEILKDHDITGYTTYEVEGNGAKGLRGQGFKNEKNVRKYKKNMKVCRFPSKSLHTLGIWHF